MDWEGLKTTLTVAGAKFVLEWLCKHWRAVIFNCIGFIAGIGIPTVLGGIIELPFTHYTLITTKQIEDFRANNKRITEEKLNLKSANDQVMNEIETMRKAKNQEKKPEGKSSQLTDNTRKRPLEQLSEIKIAAAEQTNNNSTSSTNNPAPIPNDIAPRVIKKLDFDKHYKFAGNDTRYTIGESYTIGDPKFRVKFLVKDSETLTFTTSFNEDILYVKKEQFIAFRISKKNYMFRIEKWWSHGGEQYVSVSPIEEAKD